MRALAGSLRTMTGNSSSKATGMAITAGSSMTTAGIATTTATIVPIVMTITIVTTITTTTRKRLATREAGRLALQADPLLFVA